MSSGKCRPFCLGPNVLKTHLINENFKWKICLSRENDQKFMTWHKLIEHPIKVIRSTCYDMYCMFQVWEIFNGFITEPGSNSCCSIIDSTIMISVIQMWLFCCKYVPAIYCAVSEIYHNNFLLYNTVSFTKRYSQQHPILHPGAWFNIKMLSYQYRKSHCGDKTVVRSSYLHNVISYTGKMTSLYWIRALSSRVWGVFVSSDLPSTLIIVRNIALYWTVLKWELGFFSIQKVHHTG